MQTLKPRENSVFKFVLHYLKQHKLAQLGFFVVAICWAIDEATSALDSVTEKHIQAALYELIEGKTAIAIAHRLSTLKHMDRILVFDKGVIIQDGTLNNLVKDKKGLFHTLWAMQSNGFLGE